MEAPIKILIADDHQMVIDGIKSVLADHSQMKVVATATDGLEALKMIQTNIIDIAILDIGMPGKNGIDLSREILRNHPKIKIILVTMTGNGPYISEAKQMGIHAYILKEKSSETLVDAIHAVHRGGSYWPFDLWERIGKNNDVKPKRELPASLTRKQKVLVKTYQQNPKLKSEELGALLNIASTTVDAHFRNIMARLGINRRIALLDFKID